MDGKEFECCICKKKFIGWGNDPYPVYKGDNDLCCDLCDFMFVLPARVELIKNQREEKEQCQRELQ